MKNGSIIVLELSLKRLNKLSKIRATFKEDRDTNAPNIWLKAANDWTQAYMDNLETTNELVERFQYV